MSKPVISVIVTNYNHAVYIKTSVESMICQTKSDIEIIIVDDCSTDNSKEVIEELVKLDDRIQTPIFLKENKGKWFALNTAIATARGKLITLSDADDASVPERLERQHQVLMDQGSFHNMCGFTHCSSPEQMHVAQQWKATPLGYDTLDHKTVVDLVMLGRKTHGINHYFVGRDYEVHGASSLFYKQLWEHGMKFLPGGLGLRCQKAEDSDHNTKMTLLLQKTSVLKEPLYCYRRGTSTNPAWLEEL